MSKEFNCCRFRTDGHANVAEMLGEFFILTTKHR